MQSCTSPNGSKTKTKKNKRRRQRQAAKGKAVVTGANGGQIVIRPRAAPSTVSLSSAGVSPAIDAHIRNLINSYAAKAPKYGLDSKKVVDYVQTLLCPQQFMSRYPDSWSDKSQLVRMIMEFSIPITLNSSDPDSGRFSFLVSPTLGSTSSPDQYKVAIVKTGPSVDWNNIDFSDPASYLDVVEGRDVRVDTFFQILTQPSLGCATLNATNTGQTTPFDTFDYIAPSYNLVVTPSSTTGGLVFPVGIFRVTLIGKPFGANFAVTTFGEAVGSDANSEESTDGTLQVYSFSVTVSGNESGVAINTAGPLWSACQLAITANFFTVNTDGDSVNIPLEGGVINTYRPVSMSCLASYTGPTLTDGGNLSAALLPGSASSQNYFTSNPAKNLGQLQNWENLAQVPGALKDTKLKTGAYCYWKPEKISDSTFQTASSAAKFPFPTMCFSGTYVPGSDVPDGQQNVLRVVVATNYEMLTTSQLWEQSALVGSQATVDYVNAMLANEPTSMENPAHKNFIQRMIDKVKRGIGWG